MPSLISRFHSATVEAFLALIRGLFDVEIYVWYATRTAAFEYGLVDVPESPGFFYFRRWSTFTERPARVCTGLYVRPECEPIREWFFLGFRRIFSIAHVPPQKDVIWDGDIDRAAP